ncbi:nuclear pore complex protein Nup160 homolog [Bacillus rossius redtenbacheri]|uniref:nuclear pore complex protein Nup160 homolog n=1 Tax=Bacillus rossius redtenbacheri TaxID=93214 RepID=UPI002FDE8A94
MKNFSLGYREVIPDQTLPEKWKEFTLNMGGTQFTLQETKVPDSSGGYSYKDPSNRFTRNRFIYWRIQRNELELEEHSLEVNLRGNRVRYRFQNTLLLEGLSVHESGRSVVVLLATASSVHRLRFPHPRALHRQYESLDRADINVQSVFADASFAAASDTSTFYVINNALASANIPHTSTSYLTEDGTALFALAYKTGLVHLVRMSESGETSVQEIRESRGFLSGLADAFTGGKTEDVVPVSMVLHGLAGEVYLFSLCCGGSLRIIPCYNRARSNVVFNVNSHGNECHKCVDIRGARRHVLRKSVDPDDGSLCLAAFLHGRTTSEFCVLAPAPCADGTVGVELVGRRFHDPKDHILVDVCATRRRLWALWHTMDEAPVLLTSRLGADACPEWEPVLLEPAPDREPPGADPREHPRRAFAAYIFQPGLFPLAIIARALNVYLKSPVRGGDAAAAGGGRELEARVCRAMEEAARERAAGRDLAEDERLGLARACWAQLCSSCVSFHRKATRALGLVPAAPADAVLIVKQAQFSLVRPMDALEHLMLARLERCSPEHFASRPVLGDSPPATCAALVRLMGAVQELAAAAPEALASVLRGLDELRPPASVAEEALAGGVLGGIPQSVLRGLETLAASTDVAAAVRALVGALACDLGEPRGDDDGGAGDGSPRGDVPKLFGSQLGASTVAQSLRQVVEARLAVCCAALLCQKLLLSNTRIGLALDSGAAASLAGTYERTCGLAQLYHVLAWACRQTAAPPAPEGTVSLAGQLASSPRRLTLAELCFQASPAAGFAEALERLGSPGDSSLHMWQCSMLSYVTTLGSLLWPAAGARPLVRLLASAGQPVLLEQLDRVLARLGAAGDDPWRSYVLGASHLAAGEERKALWLLERAPDGAGDDFFRRAAGLDPRACAGRSQLLVAYYTKVIAMFEQRGHHECVIRLAVRGIASAPDNQGLATLKSVLFGQYLQLRRWREAYEAMSTNPDPERRDSHLRQLVLRLFDQERLDLLLEFCMQGVQETQDKVEAIVRRRARTLAAPNNPLYRFLLALHLEQGSPRRAAGVAYEQGLRLALEAPGDAASLRLQRDCLLACLSLLRAGPPRYAWIVRPALEEEERDSGRVPRSDDPASGPRGEGPRETSTGRAVEVLELSDVKREYELVCAHLELIKYNPQRATKGNRRSASELVAELINEGLYRAALRLCRAFRLSAEPVVEGLATDCAGLGAGDEAATWEWLARNDVADLQLAGRSAQDVAWKLLQHLVDGAEEPHASLLHRAAARRLCRLAAFLPEWLLAGCKRRDPAGLLRVLLGAGRLADAARLAEEHVWAVLGHGRERFGLESALVASGPQACVPAHAIDLLLHELRDAGAEDDAYRQMHNALQQLMAYYLETAMRVSRDMLAG